MSAISVAPIAATQINVASIAATKKRGRPSTGCALSQRERDRRYRAKRAFKAAVVALEAAGLSPYSVLGEILATSIQSCSVSTTATKRHNCRVTVTEA